MFVCFVCRAQLVGEREAQLRAAELHDRRSAMRTSFGAWRRCAQAEIRRRLYAEAQQRVRAENHRQATVQRRVWAVLRELVEQGRERHATERHKEQLREQVTTWLADFRLSRNGTAAATDRAPRAAAGTTVRIP